MIRRATCLILTWSLAGGAGPAAADVSMRYHIAINGTGGAGSSESEEITFVKGLRWRLEEHSLVSKAAPQNATRSNDSVTIIRLDREWVAHLDVSKKTYEETSFRELRGARDGQAQPPVERSTGTAPTHTVTRADVKITPTSEFETINGFPCRKYRLMMSLEVRELATRKKSRSRMVNTLWMTPETAELKRAQAEQRAFSKAYREKLSEPIGGQESRTPREAEALSSAVAAALAGAGEREVARALRRLSDESRKLKGFTVSTQTEWYLSGTALPSATAPTETPALSMTSDVRAVSIAPLDDARFDIPSDYKKINE